MLSQEELLRLGDGVLLRHAFYSDDALDDVAQDAHVGAQIEFLKDHCRVAADLLHLRLSLAGRTPGLNSRAIDLDLARRWLIQEVEVGQERAVPAA